MNRDNIRKVVRGDDLEAEALGSPLSPSSPTAEAHGLEPCKSGFKSLEGHCTTTEGDAQSVHGEERGEVPARAE
jgi:hypothetical protein